MMASARRGSTRPRFLVGLSGGALDHAQRANKMRVGAQSGDRVIFNSARCLRAEICTCGHFNKSKRIFFFPNVRHATAPFTQAQDE